MCCCLELITSYGCIKIDPRIIKDQSISKYRRYTIVVLMVLLSLFSFGSFITAAVWASRITPWYLKGKRNSIGVWILVLLTCLSTLLCLICFVIFLIQSFCKTVMQKLFIAFNFFIVAGTIFALVAFAYGTQSAFNEETRRSIKIPCSKIYFECTTSIMEKIEKGENINYEKYYKWVSHGIEYICQDIMSPSIAMAIIQFVLYIFFICLTTGCCCCPYDEAKSENEDDENKNENNDDGPPNQNSNQRVDEV